MEVALNAMQLLYFEGKLQRREITKKLGENDSLVNVVLISLSREGFIESSIGVKGGYELAPKFDKLKVSELFEMFDRRYIPNPTRGEVHASERLSQILRNQINIPLITIFSG